MPATRIVHITKQQGAALLIDLSDPACSDMLGVDAAVVRTVAVESPLHGLLVAGDAILFINGVEVQSANAAAARLLELDGRVDLTVRPAALATASRARWAAQKQWLALYQPCCECVDMPDGVLRCDHNVRPSNLVSLDHLLRQLVSPCLPLATVVHVAVQLDQRDIRAWNTENQL